MPVDAVGATAASERGVESSAVEAVAGQRKCHHARDSPQEIEDGTMTDATLDEAPLLLPLKVGRGADDGEELDGSEALAEGEVRVALLVVLDKAS